MIDQENVNALYIACDENNSEMCQLLMENGCNPNCISKTYKTTCLIKAAAMGNKQITKMLLNLDKKFTHSFDWVCKFYIVVLRVCLLIKCDLEFLLFLLLLICI